jgi:hypothetical protein
MVLRTGGGVNDGAQMAVDGAARRKLERGRVVGPGAAPAPDAAGPPGQQLRPALRSEVSEDTAHVLVHLVPAEAEPGGELLVRITLQEAAEDRPEAGRQRRRRVRGDLDLRLRDRRGADRAGRRLPHGVRLLRGGGDSAYLYGTMTAADTYVNGGSYAYLYGDAFFTLEAGFASVWANPYAQR